MKKELVVLLVMVLSMACGHLSTILAGETPTDPATVITLAGKLSAENADLTIQGKLTHLNPAYFDLATIKKLKPVSFQTGNHWSGTKETFTGVLLYDLLIHLGMEASASLVEIVATNDYRVTVKINELERYDYLLSYAIDHKDYGDHEPSRNKGPFAIAINFDKHPQLDWDIYKHHLVWFVETIIVK